MDPIEKGGVEEKKEESEDSPKSLRNPQSSEILDDDDDEQKHGFQARLQTFASSILGSCGSAIEAAACFVQHQTCKWPMQATAEHEFPPGQPAKPPLSIADELRRLAAMEGRPFPVGTRRADIPKFLGEDAVYDWEDDNISAISQHTLEEMARHGVIHPTYRRRPSNLEAQNTPPSPAVSTSGSGSGGTDSAEESFRKHGTHYVV